MKVLLVAIAILILAQLGQASDDIPATPTDADQLAAAAGPPPNGSLYDMVPPNASIPTPAPTAPSSEGETAFRHLVKVITGFIPFGRAHYDAYINGVTADNTSTTEAPTTVPTQETTTTAPVTVASDTTTVAVPAPLPAEVPATVTTDTVTASTPAASEFNETMSFLEHAEEAYVNSTDMPPELAQSLVDAAHAAALLEAEGNNGSVTTDANTTTTTTTTTTVVPPKPLPASAIGVTLGSFPFMALALALALFTFGY